MSSLTYWERECQFMDVIRLMESRGVRIDTDECNRQIAIGQQKMKEILVDLKGLNPGSPKDLKALLVDKIGLPVLARTPKGAPSFTKDVMEDYDAILEAETIVAEEARRIAQQVLEFRGWQKTVSSNYISYLDKLSPDGRLRPNYLLHGTKTGRMSCNNPNLQQIPRSTDKPWNGHLKRVFIPQDGYVLLNVDYSQLEFRLGSAYAGQQNLLDIFNSYRATGVKRDVFTEMSAVLNRPRHDCKTLTYAKMYGAGLLKICIMLGEQIPDQIVNSYMSDSKDARYAARNWLLDRTDAGQFYQEWEQEYKELVALARRVNKVAENRHYIKYWTGRRRHFQHGIGAHKAFNSLIQGGGAEVVKSAMIRLAEEIDGPECRMLLQVHDSVLFEVHADKLADYRGRIADVMANVESERNFGVHFATDSDLWGIAA